MRSVLPLAVLAAVAVGCGSDADPVADRASQVAAIDRPRALARIDDDAGFALAGDAALVARARGRILVARAIPLSGAGPASDVFRFEAPEGAVPSPRLDASSLRAGLVVTTEDDGSSLRAAQSFAGPATGPWEALTPLRELQRDEFFPAWNQVDGETLFTTELRGDLREIRFVVREPGAEPREVDLPPEVIETVFAGDLVAYAVPVKGQPSDDEPRRLVVRNWRTAEQRSTAVIREGIESIDLRPDGRVVVNDDGGGLIELRDGTTQRRLTRTGIAPAYVGDRIVFVRQAEREGDERLAVVEPGGRVRAFGVPTARIQGFAVDGSRVLWRGNGCLLVADVTARAAADPGRGPCPRSELFLDDYGGSPVLDRSRRVPLTLRCIAAAPPGCRGTVRLQFADGPAGNASAPLRFRIPAGRSRRLAPRLTRRAYRAAIREARQGMGGAALVVYATAVDPSGRRSRLSDGYAVEVPRRLR